MSMNKAIDIPQCYASDNACVSGWIEVANKVYKDAELTDFFYEKVGAGDDFVMELLKSISGNFSFIIENGENVIAATDRIRSFPVYYYYDGKRFMVSHSARRLAEKFGCTKVNDAGVFEFMAGGYVTGRETVYENLYQVLPGEYIKWNGAELKRTRYYSYQPVAKDASEEELLEELAQVTDDMFKRLVKRCAGKPIWIPLSGGLDSRIIACKLHEFGHENLHTFSYGTEDNDEANAAKHVADTLGISWRIVPCTKKKADKFFHTATRKAYWDFSDGLSAMPFIQDTDVLISLREQGVLPDDAIIINGQTGDYITGGHVKEEMKDISREVLAEMLIDKHFALWAELLTPKKRKMLAERIRNQWQELKLEPYALSEFWEWQERQCKYVIHGQRSYDFLNLSWELPLWDSAFMDFWAKVPMQHKIGQSLYKKYLNNYNYRGLFKDFSPSLGLYSGSGRMLGRLMQAVNMLFGKNVRNKLQKLCAFFGHRSYQYGGYSLPQFLRYVFRIRHAKSFWVKTWLEENGFQKFL